MSRLARVPLNNVKILLAEKGDEGFHGLYTKSELPESMMEAVSLAVKAMLELEKSQASKNIKALNFSPLEVMEKMAQLSPKQDVPNLHYLLAMMQHHLRS